MHTQIYPQQWIALPKATRTHLAEVFHIRKTGVSEIRDQEVVSDGYSADDLKSINLDKMCEYIGSVETFARAWEITLAKVHSELNPPIGEIRKTSTEESPVIDERPDLADTLKPLAPWCDTCDSKGVRHKKICPKFVAIERNHVS